MKFNPDEYLIAKAEASGFNPDQYLSQKIPKTSAAQTALESFGKSASFGYLPQLQAAAEPITTSLLNLISGQKVETPSYVARRDENIARSQLQAKEHPTASLAGSVGGALATGIPLSSIRLVQGGGKLMQLLNAAATGGAVGAISNPGDVQGEISPLQLSERAKDTITGAAISGALHGTGEGISTGAKALGSKLTEMANKFGFRALGPFKRQVNQNRENIQQIGREAIENKVIDWKPTTAAGLEERAASAASTAGKDLGKITEELLNLESQTASSGITRKQLADNLRQKLVVEKQGGIPALNKRNETFQKMISEFEKDPKIIELSKRPEIKKAAGKLKVDPYELAESVTKKAGYEPTLTFGELRSAKMAVQGTKDQEGLINWNRLKDADIPIDEQFHRALATELRQGEEQGANAIEKAYFGQQSNRFERAKEKFGNLSTAAQITSNRADAQRANQLLGLRDVMTGSAGAGIGAYLGHQVGGLEGAAAGAAIGGFGGKMVRDFGPQVSAKIADMLAEITKSPILSESLGAVQKKASTVAPLFYLNRQRGK